MTSAYILIAAILVMGGVLATLGDRIGTRVGKARLSLFNLRPRNTATLVTILTGSLISASTLGVLFGLSESLRDGVFELDDILQKLRHARRDYETVKNQKDQVEKALGAAKAEQAKVQERLDETNRNFQEARTQLKKVSQQATILRNEIKSLLAERQQLIQERNKLNQEITQLKELVAQRDLELDQREQQLKEKDNRLKEKDNRLKKQDQKLVETDRRLKEKDNRLKEQDQELKEQDQLIAAIAQRELLLKEAITQRETRLQELEAQLTQREEQLAERNQQLQEREKQLAFLEQQVEVLEQYYQNYQVLRQGNVALLRGQILAFGVVRIVEPSAASTAVDQLLREANRTALEIIQPSNGEPDEPLVQITETQAKQLINQIKDGRDYVVRILSAGNYVVGEHPIQVFADAAINQVVFEAGDILGTISTDASTMTDRQIQQRLDQLLAAAQFRARRAGVLGKIQVGDGTPTTLVRFIEQLKQYDQPLEISAVAQEVANTAGPLKMQLVVTQNGQVIFGS
ncbi:MAG TPA: DUF3084 domain-containing protein [Cyanobacteria bacterium UBA8803]|nr:DUF3084 domain-containing protein [Cyanobacteria bacterium UBA9273]HBL57559.1 DUF3084 domain-containing protein [Cyanobacteria bacterium UBA8803]